MPRHAPDVQPHVTRRFCVRNPRTSLASILDRRGRARASHGRTGGSAAVVLHLRRRADNRRPAARLEDLGQVEAHLIAFAVLVVGVRERAVPFLRHHPLRYAGTQGALEAGVDLVEGALGEAVGKIYIERHFSPVAKERMDQLVANLIEAYRQSIIELDWMTEATKQRAFDKLRKFRPHIGFPSKWRDYSTLQIDRHALVDNVMRTASFEVRRSVDKIGQPIDREEWLMTPQTVNAYYHPLRNEIVFPAAILQPPFFSEDADDAINYGGIGAVIGHEIGHGFDDQGSTCDGDGALVDWWTAEDRAAFEKRTRILIDQYGELEPAQAPGHRVNGELTIGENI